MPPAPVPNTNGESPFLSKIPPEIRNRIFELVLTREDCVEVPVDRTWGSTISRATKKEIRKSLPPPITKVCRQLREETLPMFVEMNDFLFNTNYMDSYGAPVKWLNIMRPYLTSMRALTFILTTWSAGGAHREVIVNISHNKEHNCWAVTSMDDWKDEDHEVQWALECDSDLLWRLMAQMMDRRSRADLSPE